MQTRHPLNKNLILHDKPTFNGKPIYEYDQLIQNYLQKIDDVCNKALAAHPRTLLIRFDLHMPAIPNCPDYPLQPDPAAISRFNESMKSQYIADQNRKRRDGKRVRQSTYRYLWVKEINSALQPHYHFAMLLNNDTYNTLGSYTEIGNNNASRIIKAWASALRIEEYEAMNLVHFPDKPIYYLDRLASNFNKKWKKAFYRLSYFAKVSTKNFGTGDNLIGCSRD